MANARFGPVYRQIGRLFGSGTVVGLDEGQLLDRFLDLGDAVAFEAIVARHGPMVLGVCRALLRDPNDVDDAFQAVFLVLVKRAGSLRRRDLLGPWLHGVARRVALRARAEASKRRDRLDGVPETAAAVPSDLDRLDLRASIHAEVERLPTSYRAAVVLCYFEGRTHEQAALELGWPVGTVRGRLARARDLLRGRLARRGLAPTAVALLATLSRGSRAAVPHALVGSTTKAATLAATAPLATALASSAIGSARAFLLAQGVLPAMSTTPLKLGATLLVAGILAAPGVLAVQSPDPGPNSPPTGPRAGASAKVAEPVKTDSAEKPESSAEARLKIAEEAIATLKDALEKEDDELKRIEISLVLEVWARLAQKLHAQIDGPDHDYKDALRALREARDNEARDKKRLDSGEISKAAYLSAQYNRVQIEDHLADMEKARQQRAKSAPVANSMPGEVKAPVQADPPQVMPDPEPRAQAGGAIEGGAIEAENPRPRRLPKPNPADADRDKVIEEAMEQTLNLNFPVGTPLDEIITYVRAHTKDEKAGLKKGVPIYLDPIVLIEDLPGEPKRMKKLVTLVPIEIEDLPLRVALRLVLDQFSLSYQVRDRMVYVIDEQLLDFRSEGAADFMKATGSGMPGPGRMGGMGGMM